MEEEVGERWRSEERVWEVEEEVVVGRRERVVGAVAEAMAKCLCYVSEKSERGRECVCVCVCVCLCLFVKGLIIMWMWEMGWFLIGCCCWVRERDVDVKKGWE